MNSTHYERYKVFKEAGRRAEASAEIGLFVKSLETFDEKSSFVRWFLEHEPQGQKIRHELYEHVIFPVLLDGYRRRDPWSLWWLAITAQNLYGAKHLWHQVDGITDFALLQELHGLSPNDDQVRIKLLERQMEWFQFCVHEWPAGILYGMDGATLEQCQEIADAVECAIQLDKEGRYTEFLADFSAKLRQYRARIENAPKPDSR